MIKNIGFISKLGKNLKYNTLIGYNTNIRYFCEVKDQEQEKEKEKLVEFINKYEMSSSYLSEEPYNRLLNSANIKKEESDKFKEDIKNIYEIKSKYDKIKVEQEKTEKNLDLFVKTNHELKKILKDKNDEIEGVTNRLNKEIEKEKIFGISKFAKEILEILDNLERILKFNEDKKEEFKDIYMGIDMTYNNALNILKRFEIHRMEDILGQKVNLNHHEITFNIPDPSKNDEEIIHVENVGYLIKDRVLRVSKVGTVKNN